MSRLRTVGVCTNCHQPAEGYFCGQCREKWKRYRRQRIARTLSATGVHPEIKLYREGRQKCISHYGGCCEVCGERRLPFLTIDHIDGGGTQHRKTTRSIYSWLIARKYPAGYRVLCWNHNYLASLAKIQTARSQDRRAKNYRRYYAKLRDMAFSAYGDGRCACCGYEGEALTIDHVKNDGAAERRKLGSCSKAFWRHLRDAGFPPGYRVLCFNCNSGRAVNGGVCPHEAKPTAEDSADE